jgi:hypothetical protein
MGHADLNAGGKQMVIPATGSPTVPRMILGRQLETLRERAGLSHEQAAETILASAWTIRRIELAEGGRLCPGDRSPVRPGRTSR